MYKKRFTEWGLGKNYRESEMRAIVRKNKQRKDRGKQSIIHVRGKAIDDGEVTRYWKRKGISIDDVIAHRTASATPEAVQLFTPVPPRLATPESFAVPERMFIEIRDYFKASFESGNWVHGDPQIQCYTRKVQGNPLADLNALLNHSSTACHLFSTHSYEEAGKIIMSATSALKGILSAEDPQTLSIVLEAAMRMRYYGHHEIALSLLRQCSALGEVVVGNKHPLRLICGWLASADASQFEENFVRCLRSVTDHFESFLGLMHASTLNSRISYARSIREPSISQSRDILHNLMGQCDLQLGPLDQRSLFVRAQLAVHYLEFGQYVEALEAGQHLIALTRYSQSHRDVSFFRSHGLFIVAESQYGLGDTFLAETNLREAIEVRISGWGSHDSHARLWLVYLENWLLEQGQWGSAVEVRERRMGMMDPKELI